jgi:hypothetical protein
VRPSTKRRTMRRVITAKEEWAEGIGRDGSRAGGADDPCNWPETFARVHHALRQIDIEESGHYLSVIARNWPDIQRAGIAWLDLIHVLVQSAEEGYRPVGKGQLKKDEVKTVIVFLIRSERADIPHVPRSFEPVVVDVVADFAVDAVVALLNANAPRDPNWREAPRARPGLREVWRIVKFSVKTVLRPFVDLAGRVLSWVYFRLRHPAKVSPAIRKALERIEKDADTAKRPGLIHEVSTLIAWAGRNRDSIVGVVELVGVVVEVVEGFRSMTGPQKKACATQLVHQVLEELGFDTGGLVVKVKLDLAVDFAIDATVHLFNKRGIFEKSDLPEPLYPDREPVVDRSEQRRERPRGAYARELGQL